MGVDLYVYGNHNIFMSGCSLHDIAKTLETEINNLVIPNIEYLKQEELKYHQSPPISDHIEDLKKISKWTVEPVNSNSEKTNEDKIVFYGPMGLNFILTSTNIQFGNPTYRYNQWYYPEWQEQIKEWRRYYYQITLMLKGDKVIYLADAFLNKYMDKFYTHGYKFSKIESELISEYGANTKHLYEYTEDDYPLYYIDDFHDITNSGATLAAASLS
jgi:hypothetical protein